MNDPTSPGDGGFGGSAFPAMPGRQRKTDMDEEQQITGQMAQMDISGGQRPAPRGRGGMAPSRGPSQDGYGGRPPMDGPGRGPRPPPPQQGYQEPRRGPPPSQGYGPPMGYQEENFGPPARSMTMPTRDPQMAMRDPGFPPRGESMRQNGPSRGQGMVPPRPSTAQAMRQPPREMYPPNNGPQGGYQEPGYDNADAGYGGPQQRPASLDDFYGYYDDPRGSGDYGAPQPQHRGSMEPGMPEFDAVPSQRPRESYDSQLQSPPIQGQPQGGPQRGPGRFPEVSRTKSQPDLRQSQTAIFEMAGDMPPIPAQYQQSGPPQNGQFDQRGYEQPGPPGPPPPGPGLPSNPAMGHVNGQFGRSASYDQPGPPPTQGLPSHPTPYRPGQHSDVQPGARPLQPAQSADSLPSHPVPVRVGLMPKPPPVRNYNGGITPTPVPASAPPSIQSQAPPPQQPAGGGPPPQPKQPEAPVTVAELERLKTLIKTNPQDQASALSLARKLVEAADVLVPLQPDPRSRTRSRERYLTDAQKVLKKLNSAGNVDAMFFLADCMGRGLFSAGEPDNKEAFLLYQSAAKQGHAQAAYRTAVCCEIGNEEGGGTRKDPLKAFQWYKRASHLGDTPAMYKVGMILLKGLLGQPRNPREAISWLKRAAERADAENPHALHELGLLYETAEDNGPIVRDPAYAFQLFKQAADLGYKFSQFRLGAAYEYGLMGVPVDARQSIMWYSRAAGQAEHQSELALSGWYLTGSEGVLQQSDTEAYLWARKAAQAGLAKAEFAMGYYTEQGIGVPENLEDAKRWYWRAAGRLSPFPTNKRDMDS
jgi:TPR repeat protein